MNTFSIACRICGRPVQIEFDDDALPDAVDRLHDLVVHDECVPPRWKPWTAPEPQRKRRKKKNKARGATWASKSVKD